jgi:hypothetical protein
MIEGGRDRVLKERVELLRLVPLLEVGRVKGLGGLAVLFDHLVFMGFEERKLTFVKGLIALGNWVLVVGRAAVMQVVLLFEVGQARFRAVLEVVGAVVCDAIQVAEAVLVAALVAAEAALMAAETTLEATEAALVAAEATLEAAEATLVATIVISEATMIKFTKQAT